jgi:hypothetical protein
LLRGDQIRTALFPLNDASQWSCRRVLLNLVRHRYLATVPRSSPIAPTLYLLDRSTVPANRYLRHLWGAARLRSYMTRIGAAEHLLGVNDLFVRLVRSNAEGAISLASWQRGEQLQARLPRSPVVPDAHFITETPSSRGPVRDHFIAEYERVPKSTKVLESKIANWIDYLLSADYEEAFGPHQARLLVVFSDQPGVAATTRIASGQRIANGLGATFVRFASLETIRQGEPSDLLFQPLWYRPDRDTPVRLITPS